MKTEKYTIQQFHRDFPDNGACLEYLFRARFGKPVCPSCKHVDGYYNQKGTSAFICTCGGHQLSPKKDTIFEKSDTDLVKWFFAMFLVASNKNGVSAKELERNLDVTYKTAWRIGQQIRSLMEQKPGKSRGVFEADETYIGGRGKGVRGRGSKTKTPVFGVLKRKGNIYTKSVPNVARATIMPHLHANVAGGSTICTDEYHVYKRAFPTLRHETVNHGSKEYVRGIAHTNGLEGHWSQVKRSIKGTYVHVSAKWLQAYLDEFSWRYNRRSSPTAPFHGLLAQVT